MPAASETTAADLLNSRHINQIFLEMPFSYSATDSPELEHVQSTRWVCLDSFIKLLINEL